MFRKEKTFAINLNSGLSTFIKHGFNTYVKWPLLNIGVILNNTTTAVNEEWLTSIEHMPTRKILYKYTYKILKKEVGFLVYLNSSQTQEKNFISLYDFDYYIIDSDFTLIAVDKPKELKNTLLHIFQEYRVKNLQHIELIAFSSNTQINDTILEGINFLNIETFNREYANIKPILNQNFVGYNPFIVTAPSGNLTFYIDDYEWIDLKSHLKEIFDFLEEQLIFDVKSHKLETSVKENQNVSSYNTNSGMLYVNDLLTMCVVNFFGCNSRLNTYHKFDITKVDTYVFLNELSVSLKKIIDSI
ncbi:RNA polymerase subunit rpo35 [Tanapox virus]|uniref:DNA-directed RNA polymerase 35 kDa subunit n=2 Tax=Tanapox virus TaxID=99000 RepID=A7XCQ2_9POXV|nr:119L protein [Yaba-like disease virus]ABQ43594.1 RNA polymerase subunit rpo35 [Tanapox virus]ABQ43749.1 RNA polymerase subunit rpo35 [Tanapox virus]CAC21357.1 119L protein [Yaba-like disease virus]